MRQADRAHFAIVQAREEFQWLGAMSLCSLIDAQDSRRILVEGCGQRLARRVERALLGGDGCRAPLSPLGEHTLQPVGPSQPALKRPAQYRDEQFVYVHLLAGEALAPAA